MHDARIGRFFARDPLAAKYAYNSPYAFQENKLGWGVEFEGLELVKNYEVRPGMRANLLSTVNHDAVYQFIYETPNSNHGEIWVITELFDNFNNSTGNRVEKYASKDSYKGGKGKPYSSGVVRDWKQLIHAKDNSVEGSDGMVEGLKSGAYGMGAIIGAASFAAEVSALGAVWTFFDVTFSIDEALRFEDQTILSGMAREISPESGEKILEFTKFTVTVTNLAKGLYSLSGVLKNGKNVEGEWDAINGIFINGGLGVIESEEVETQQAGNETIVKQN